MTVRVAARPVSLVLPTPPPPPGAIGLIAGGGRLPVIVAEGMRAAGYTVHALSIGGQALPDIDPLCASVRRVGAFKLGSWGKILRRTGVTHAVMVGRVDKAALMHNWAGVLKNIPDVPALMMWFRIRRDRRSHRILGEVADILARNGVMLMDSTVHIPEHMATAGPMTRRTPSAFQAADIAFGWPLLVEMLRLDIGQSMSVRMRDVIAVEAVEGTDRMIERTGQLCPATDWTLLKGARAGHDKRSDVPTIGPDTIRHVHKAGGRCIALAAGEVIIIDRPATLALAEQLGIAVHGVESRNT